MVFLKLRKDHDSNLSLCHPSYSRLHFGHNSFAMKLFFPGPRDALLFLDHVAKPAPFEFPLAEWTTQSHLAVGDCRHLPISISRTAFDHNFLADKKIMQFEYRYLVDCHRSPPVDGMQRWWFRAHIKSKVEKRSMRNVRCRKIKGYFNLSNLSCHAHALQKVSVPSVTSGHSSASSSSSKQTSPSRHSNS